jgi:hypothetical protein
VAHEMEKTKSIISNAEIDSFVKEGKAIFTNDEIYKYSRPDSVKNIFLIIIKSIIII